MSRSISCGHCGGVHASVAEVRACSAGDLGAGPALPAPAPAAEEAPRPVARQPLSEVSAGPAALGRSVLVLPGQVPPPAWEGAPVVRVTGDPDPEVLDRLHLAWLNRERLVVELEGDLPEADPVLEVPFWELGPGTELPGERLSFLLTANAVDLRAPGAPGFPPVEAALTLGAQPGGPADVVLPGGTPAWVDGGPLEPLPAEVLDGQVVVPRVHLVAGRLSPLAGPAQPAADLAPDQLAAVAHLRGPARIIAPAGSGKTRVLTERTRHLVRDRGVEAAAVSLVAYNRRAREEMQQRLTDVPGLDVRTLNSLALAIATGTGGFARPRRGAPRSTIDEREARRLLEDLVPTGRRRRANTDPLEPWIDALSACRLGLRSPAAIEDEYADVTDFDVVLRQYREALARRNVLDFDEQILAAIEVLLTDPAARARARSLCPVLLVDEFQDLTPAHLLLVRLLAGPAAEVFAVGDDDQTIYGYSGASPDWLVDFARYFPGAVDHPLTVNYRCPPTVVEAASHLLTHNRRRVPKEIHARDGRRPGAGDLSVVHTEDVAGRLVQHVQELLAAGAVPGDVAVLARVNAALLPALLFLDHAGIPVVRPPGLDPSLLDRSGTAAALAWLQLATAGSRNLSPDALQRALRRPPRSLHPRVAGWVAERRTVKDLLALSRRVNTPRDSDTIAAFAADIARLQEQAGSGATSAQLLDVVYDEIGLLGAASQLDRSQRTTRRAAHSDELAALRAVAPLHPDPDGFGTWLRSRLTAIARHGTTAAGGDAVTLATIHSTKGLEWPHVVVYDARADLHPHHLAADREEERRIFHVALTRGRQSVLVLAGPPPSPFLREMEQPRRPDEPWDEPKPAVRAVASARPAPAAVSLSPADASLKDALKRWRADRSRADGVPAYVVFNDSTLDEITVRRPSSLAELGQVKGIGPAKLDRYGDEILAVVAAASPG